jgi:Uma2 family endonuclease
VVTTPSKSRKYDIFRKDRPGWIPESVGDDWDLNPYAYQTEEQLMPAGRFHGLYLQTLGELFNPLIERAELYLLFDVFIFYRDWEGRKQRIAPDALIAPAFTEIDDEQAARSYDLDVEPLPLCVIELTSPESQKGDRQSKRLFYAALGIHEYLLLDIVDEDGRLRPQIGVEVWRLEAGNSVAVEPDDEGYVIIETIGARLRADNRRLVAQALSTGEYLRTNTELLAALEVAEQARLEAEQARLEAEQARLKAEQARLEAEQRAKAEAAARLQAETELLQLRAELERLRGSQQE